MVLTQKEFDEKCIDLMEKIVRLKICTIKERALSVAEEMMVKAKAEKCDDETKKVFEKVIEEFTNVSAEDYASLRKQILNKYQNVITETENIQIRQEIQQIRNNNESFQYELLKAAKAKNYYNTANKATQQEIKNVKDEMCQ